MVARVTCYGGVGEVGGNKILLEDGERRILFDFGKAFGRYGAYFDGVFIRERVARGLLDPLALGLVPPLRGLLRDDLIPVLDPSDLSVTEVPPSGARKKPRKVVRVSPRAADTFWQYFERALPGAFRDLRRANAPPVDLVILSHAHQDHISDLQYVTHDVPAASSVLTAFVSKVLLDTGMAGGGGAPFFNRRALDEQGRLSVEKGEDPQTRPWWFLDADPEGAPGDDPLENPAAFWSMSPSKELQPSRMQPIADLRLQAHPVDHSLLGAIGVAVETGEGWVAYTGDLRFHGVDSAKTWAYAQALASLRPAVLLCEGTRLTSANDTTEAEVLDNCLAAVRAAAGQLVVADFAPRNVERLKAFLQIAHATNRRLLLQPKDAYLLRAVHLADPESPDAMADPHIGIYDDPKVTEQKWESLVRDRFRKLVCGPQEVTRHPEDIILAFSLTDVADMLDLQLLLGGRPGGLYLFSNSQAYDEEQMVDLVRLWKWTEHLGLHLVGLEARLDPSSRQVTQVVPQAGYHASGHAGQAELVRFVKEVRPARLIPIHTEAPEHWHSLLAGSGIAVDKPEYARAMPLGGEGRHASVP